MPSAIASSPPAAARLVMGLLEAGIPLSLLADLTGAGPDSASIYRTELTGAAGSPDHLDPHPDSAHRCASLLSGKAGVGFEDSGRPPS